MKSNKLNVFPLLLLMPSTSLIAATNGVTFDLAASAKYSDNATRQEDEKIGEMQNQYDLGVNAHYDTEWMYLTSEYNAQRQTFEKELQPNYNMLEGTTELNFGRSYDPASLLITHSRRSLLNTPDAIDSTRNRDERDIITAQPKFTWRATDADSLILSGSVSDISYRTNDSKDSTQTGGQFIWSRNITRVDQLQLSVNGSKTEFDNFPASDYEYQSIALQYSAQLSHLSYSIRAGQNRAIRDDSEDDYSNPSYTFVGTYTSGVNTFKLVASQLITDSSRGNGNRQSLSDSDNEAINVGIDLINIRELEVSWSTSALCERCLVNVNASTTESDYQSLPEDSDESSVGAGISYKLTRAASLRLDVGRHKRSFADESARGDYTADRGNISFNYAFVNDVSLKVYMQAEKRDSSGTSQNYDENIAGISLSYRF